MMYPISILIVIWIYYLSHFLVISEEANPDFRACQEQFLLLGSDQNMAKVVDVIIGAVVKLECNFCDTEDNFQAKNWYFKKRGDSLEPTEISVSMDSNLEANKISLTSSHTLNIINFTTNDAGIYTCKLYNHQEPSIFTYVVDGVFNNKIIPKIGKLNEWQEYKRINLNPVNKNFEESQEYPYSELTDNYNFTFRIITAWETWGKCESCGRHKGIRRKIGKCRLYPFAHNTTLKHTTNHSILNNDSIEIINYYLLDNYHVACASLHLNTTFPGLSAVVRNIPDFEATEYCEAICMPVVEGELTGIKKDYKYKMTKRIAENSHITLICPEVSLESSVEWLKDKEVLNSTFRNNMAESENEPHLTIDPYNSLYILQATKNEEAVYACIVNGEKIQKFDIRVVSKSKLLNQEFIRYSIYLGFVLSLTLTCYCAGMFVAWRRRASFADPLHLRNKHRFYGFDNNQEEEDLFN